MHGRAVAAAPHQRGGFAKFAVGSLFCIEIFLQDVARAGNQLQGLGVDVAVSFLQEIFVAGDNFFQCHLAILRIPGAA